MKKTQDVESVVRLEILAIQKKSGRILKSIPLTARILGGQAALDSLDVAELMVRLEKIFKVDPFKSSVGKPVRTLGDLVAFYERHGKKNK